MNVTPDSAVSEISYPRDLIPTKDTLQLLLDASERVNDRGGSIDLLRIDQLDYRILTADKSEQLLPDLCEWIRAFATSIGRKLDPLDPECVCVNIVPTGGSYAPHTDTTTSCVLVVFLNHCDGGHLALPDLRVELQPCPGRAVYLNGRENRHEIREVTLGPRLTLVANLSGDDDALPPEANYGQ